MTATIWIHGKTARIILRDDEDRVIDLDDEWNNIASAQSWVMDSYPEARLVTVRDEAKRRGLDLEWDRCKFGAG